VSFELGPYPIATLGPSRVGLGLLVLLNAGCLITVANYWRADL
jgi:hypothetical protein